MEEEMRTLRPKSMRSLEHDQLTRILYREAEQQERRVRQLEDALARDDYEKVADLVSSLDVSLNQHLTDAQLLEVRVIRPRRK